MSKNLTRKGLALGAVVALGSTLFAGAPAFAADLSLSPDTGTLYGSLLSDDFTLKTAPAGNTIYANSTALKYEIVNTSGVTLALSGSRVASGTTYSDTAISQIGTTNIYKPTAVSIEGFANKITIDPTTTSSTPTFSITIRAFSDRNNSDTVDEGDLTSDTRTVTFVKASELTPVVALDDVNAGVAPTATVTLGGSINAEQVSTAVVRAVFQKDGTAAAAVDAGGVNDAKTGLTYTATNAPATVAAGNVIGVKSQIVRYDGDTTFAESSVVTKSALAAGTANGATVTLATGANIRTATTSDFASGTPSGSTTLRAIRAGTKAVEIKVAFDKDDVAVAAGQPVSVTVRKVAIDAAAEISAGGKTLKTADTTKVYYTTTDATGSVVVAVTSLNAKAGDEIEVEVSSGSVTEEIALTWETAVLDKLVEVNPALGSAKRTVVKGGSFTLNYTAVDDFGQPWTRTDYSYRVAVAPKSGSAGTATVSALVPLTAGKGSVTITDASTNATDYTVQGKLWEQTGTSAWAEVSPAETADSQIDLVSAASVAASVTLDTAELTADGDGGAALAAADTVPASDVDLKVIDRRVDGNTQSSLAVTAGKGVFQSGTVKQADGSGAAGVAVAVSGKGIYFSTEWNGATYVSADSITVLTDENGTFKVYGFSKVAGKITISYTAASLAAKTQDITFAGAAETAADKVVIETVATTPAGRSVDVTVKVVDKYGNAIVTDGAIAGSITDVLSISLTGVGYATSIPTKTDSNGKATFKVVFGALEVGTATISASFDADGSAATYSAKTATATITVAAPVVTVVEPTSKIGTANSRVYVNVKDGKGAVVSVKIGAKWYTKSALNNDYTFSFKAKAKSKVSVKVYVDGDLSSSKTIIVKK